MPKLPVFPKQDAKVNHQQQNFIIMIDKISSTSRVTEVDASSMRIIGAYKTTSLSSDPHLALMFTALEPLSGTLSAAINRIKPGSTLEEADEDRDNKGRGLFYLVSGLSHHPTKKIYEAAQIVLAVLNKFGFSMFGESYSVESSLITSLLIELAKTELQEAIAVLPGCSDMVAELLAAQDYFEQTRIAWEQEKAEESTLQNATEVKKEVLALINEKIVVYMRAMEMVDEPNYGVFARTLAEIIADNNEVVKKRRKKDENTNGDSD